jgi:hypothetical protein
MMVEESK